ncbi:hypothetical protein SNEBB_005144 [Seison nebaliae]|nr:hypothetical protein SNEBB_005144 [Seison nebaliae]
MEDDEEFVETKSQKRKEIQGKIQNLKKKIPKKNKELKKEIESQIKELQSQLEQLNNSQTTEMDVHYDMDKALNSVEGPKVVKEKSKQKQKKENKINQQYRRANELKKKMMNAFYEKDYLNETKDIQAKLKKLNLKIFEIPADGNCLFSAISHQLRLKFNTQLSANELRKLAVTEMMENRDDYEPFFDDEYTKGEFYFILKIKFLIFFFFHQETFVDHCHAIEDGSIWGGDHELNALSKTLKRRIEIILCGGKRNVIYGEEETDKTIYLTYHQNLISTGEHYNSTIPDKIKD